MLTIADVADPAVPPTHLYFLLAGAVICVLWWRFDPKRDRSGESKPNPSPTEPVAPPRPRDAQVRAVSSHVSPDAGADETGGAEGWWGRIVRDGRGVGRRVYGTAKTIAGTGAAPLPETAPPLVVGEVPDDEGPDTEIDLALDVPDDDVVPDVVPGVVPGAYHEVRPKGYVGRESREEYIARCLTSGAEKAAIAAAVQEHYGVSRAQAYRDVGKAAMRSAA